MNRFPVFMLLLLLPGVVPLHAQVTTLKQEQDFAFAAGLFQDGNYQLALEKFLAFAQQYPESENVPDALYYAAESRYLDGNLADAAIDFERFRATYADNKLADDAGFREGEVYFRQGKWQRSHEVFTTVVKRYPEGNLAHEAAYWAGEAAFKQEDYPTAMKYYRIAYDHYPEGRIRDYAFFSIGFVHEKLERYDEALGTYDEFLKEFPDSKLTSGVYTRRGACLFGQKDYTGTLAWLDGLTDSPDPTNAAERLFLRAEAQYKLMRYAEAETFYRDFLSAYPDNARAQQVQYSLGWSCVEQKKYSEAIAVFDELGRKAGPLAEAARFRKGMALRLNGNVEAARAVFSGMIEQDPRGAYADNAALELGMSAYEAGDLPAAQQHFTTVVKEYPDSDVLADAHFMTGEVLLKANKPAAAAEAYQAAMQAPGGSEQIQANALFRLAYAHFLAGNYTVSVQRFKEFLTRWPADAHKPEALVWLAEAHFKAEQFEDAIVVYQQALTQSLQADLKQDALYGLGWAQFRSRQFAEAEATFKILTTEFRAGKHDVDANIRLGDAQFAQKHFADAISTYRYVGRMYTKDPLIPYSQLQLANAEQRNGNTPSAITTLKTLVKTWPTSEYAPRAQFSLGWLYFTSKDYDVAIGEFRRLINEYPGSDLLPNARYTIGDCLFNKGRYEDAEAAYREVLESHPDSPVVSDALEGIAQCQRMQGKDTDAAALREEWLKSNSASGAADDVAFKAATRDLDPAKAQQNITALHGFLQKYPDSEHAQEALYVLGQQQHAAGSLDDAERSYRECIAKGPGTSIAVDARIALARTATARQKRSAALAIYGELLGDRLAANRRAEVLYRRALVHKADKNFDLARNDLRNAAADASGDTWTVRASIELAVLDAEEGRVDEAAATLATIASGNRGETGAEAQYLIGRIRYDAEQYQAAEDALLRVDYVYPDGGIWNARALLLLGRTHEANGKNDRARESYDKVLKKYGGTPQADEAAKRKEMLR